MAPLVVPPPQVLDVSFPRSDWELRVAATALGELAVAVQDGAASLLMTIDLREIAFSVCWDGGDESGLLGEIVRLQAAWLVSAHEGLVIVDVSSVTDHSPHPVPVGVANDGLIEIWRDELGRVARLHNERCSDGKPFAAVGSAKGFAGLAVEGYEGQVEDSKDEPLPLVNREQLSSLADAFEFVPSSGGLAVSIKAARRNLYLLGATRIDPPRGTSHEKVHFPGARPWPLDPNYDPIPDFMLAQLSGITGVPTWAVRHTLALGNLPPRRCRLQA